MCVSVIMYTHAKLSRYLLAAFAATHSNKQYIGARAGPPDIFSNDVIALTFAAYLALHHRRLLMASIP